MLTSNRRQVTNRDIFNLTKSEYCNISNCEINYGHNLKIIIWTLLFAEFLVAQIRYDVRCVIYDTSTHFGFCARLKWRRRRLVKWKTKKISKKREAPVKFYRLYVKNGSDPTDPIRFNWSLTSDFRGSIIDQILYLLLILSEVPTT